MMSDREFDDFIHHPLLGKVHPPFRWLPARRAAWYTPRRCGACAACLRPDCKTCVNCLDKLSQGGKGKRKRGCVHRQCRRHHRGAASMML